MANSNTTIPTLTEITYVDKETLLDEKALNIGLANDKLLLTAIKELKNDIVNLNVDIDDFYVEETNTLEPGEDASVTCENGGFIFNIPRGDKGEQGEQGETGADGESTTIEDVTVSVDDQIGTPSATVTMDGTDQAKTIDIAFSCLKGEKGDKGDTGDSFVIYKTYDSVSAMEEDLDNIPVNSFCLISSTADDEDNAKLYIRTEEGLNFLTNLSDSIGIKGDKGDPGDVSELEFTVETGEPGTEVKVAQDGNKVTLTIPAGETGPAGEQGEQGEQGETGEAGKDGITPQFSIGEVETGEPDSEVQVILTGTDEAPVLNFSIPKGNIGEQGEAATIESAEATIDDTVGTPSVEVTLGGTETARTFTFAFSGLKGEKGDKGDTGDVGNVDVVEWTTYNPTGTADVKTIKLDNTNSISSMLADSASQANVASVNGEDILSVGDTQLSTNIDSKEGIVTINSTEQVATISDIPTFTDIINSADVKEYIAAQIALSAPKMFDIPLLSLDANTVYEPSEIFGWLGVSDITEFTGLVTSDNALYIRYTAAEVDKEAIPGTFKVPVQYSSVSGDIINLTAFGLAGETGKELTEYSITIDTSGTVIEGTSSNIKVASAALAVELLD